MCPPDTYSNENTTMCSNCSAGTEQPSYGRTSCEQCREGYFSVSSGPCQPCAAGTSSAEGSSWCNNCPANKFSFAGGLCKNCYSGTFWAGNGSANCSLCPLNKFSNGGLDCYDCAAGKYALPGSGQCFSCSPHSYFDGIAECIPCPAGKHEGSEGPESCSVCPGNTTSLPGRSCEPCAPGKGSSEGDPYCASLSFLNIISKGPSLTSLSFSSAKKETD